MVSFAVTVAICSNVGGAEPQATVLGITWSVRSCTSRFAVVPETGCVVPGAGCVQDTENVAVFEDTAAGLTTTIVPASAVLSEKAVTVAGATDSVPGAVKVSDRVGPFPVGSSQ